MKFNDRFLKACYRKPVDTVPVWFMRQVGRYQPEYRRLREKYSISEIIKNPELCARLTMSAVKDLGVDAAILFSDITVIFEGMDVNYEIVENSGPVIDKPLRDIEKLCNLRTIEPELDIPYVLETIRILKDELKSPLIGFSGGPFTLGSYMIEGGSTKNFTYTKYFMYNHRREWEIFMDKLTDNIILFLKSQVRSGVDALQIFDTWIGYLGFSEYKEYVFPKVKRLVLSLKRENVPIIYFGLCTSHLLKLIKELDVDVVGFDWRMDINSAWNIVGYDKAAQGNLDPAVLLCSWDVVKEKTEHILHSVRGKVGYIFNLGHGVLPETPVSNLKRLVDFVHEKGGDNYE